MEQQDTNINNAQRFFRWVNDSLYPSQRDKPRTMAELAERVVREVKDLRSRTSQGEDVDALAQMRVELARLRQQVDGLTAANAELGLLLRQPQDVRDERRQHQLAEEGMALIRSKLSGGVIVGVAKDEDNATFGLIVHRPTGEHVRAWLYRDECKVGPVHVEIEEECDA
jgi:hypothetical protein